MSILLEVCVDDADGLDAAIAGGADRIELCASLELGGLTPSPGLLQRAAQSPVPVYAMVRPRAGNFVFSAGDLELMLADIDAIRNANLAGVVLGASQPNGQLDRTLLKQLTQHATGLGITLHRAFDLVPDIAEAIEIAVELGFERILTAGGENTALAGAANLRAASLLANGRIDIMPGSGINISNLNEILAIAPFNQIHSSCSDIFPGMSGKVRALGFEPVELRRTSTSMVAQLKAACLAASR